MTVPKTTAWNQPDEALRAAPLLQQNLYNHNLNYGFPNHRIPVELEHPPQPVSRRGFSHLEKDRAYAS
ncbi:MAG: hypothetical protein KGH91_04105 [Rhodospirillales bacterium]|nr:hypothetical protein [Rhodospirillales bacterium]